MVAGGWGREAAAADVTWRVTWHVVYAHALARVCVRVCVSQQLHGMSWCETDT